MRGAMCCVTRAMQTITALYLLFILTLCSQIWLSFLSDMTQHCTDQGDTSTVKCDRAKKTDK